MSKRYRYLAKNQPKVTTLTLAQVKVNIWLATLAAAIVTLFFFGNFWRSLW